MPEAPLVFALIDDDAALRRMLAGIIAAGGDIVVEAGDWARGHVLLQEYPWDIAIIDRVLPDGNGFDLCRAIAAAPGESHRHVIVLSDALTRDEKVRGYECGADEFFLKPVDTIELRVRLSAIRRIVGTRKMLLSRLSMLEQRSVIDEMTQVYNYRFFGSELRREFDIAVRHERPLAVIMIDVDLFKNVNDTYGHPAGDRVLIDVSTTIAQTIRASDILARYGGEEFAVILAETPLSEAVTIAERVRAAVEAMEIAEGTTVLRTTISAGVAAIPSPGIDSSARLIEAADQALYLAKSNGRNRIEQHLGRALSER